MKRRIPAPILSIKGALKKVRRKLLNGSAKGVAKHMPQNESDALRHVGDGRMGDAQRKTLAMKYLAQAVGKKDTALMDGNAQHVTKSAPSIRNCVIVGQPGENVVVRFQTARSIRKESNSIICVRSTISIPLMEKW